MNDRPRLQPIWAISERFLEMIRYAFNTTGARMRSPRLPARILTTSSVLCSKARISQILQQAQSVAPNIYKTMKEKDRDDKAARRNQLIWLVKHSLGNVEAAAKVSPHDLPWSTRCVEKVGDVKVEGGRLDVTVWPHLW
ncbi:uncharacterized protein N0V89_002806 [Didymosphaeria variabile]|uniref:Uncharacterized protein n=1 Tax=Didymosphaeria variabile TaxID=1932322 RepID=A0A9W8XT76_9PLEO|nr:uncharacterized protein N0V89_002806 [Didymosphaeria variabile]KAJ4358226.1 hypothetical protein N0V89_002806 [Didymosphaeria variabile]